MDSEIDSSRSQSKALGDGALELTWMDEVEEHPIEWIEEGWLARRSITLVDGDPGVNKSAYVYDVAARISRDNGLAVLLTAEDDIRSVAKPRLRAAGADLSRVVVLQASFDPETGSMITIPEDIQKIATAIKQARTRCNPSTVLIAVDPIVAYLDSAATNSWKDQDVRRALTPLQKLCAAEDAACLVIRHFKKDTDASLMHRGGGSIGFQGLVRLSCAIVLDPDDEEPDPNKRRRLLVAVKSNLGAKARTKAFRVEPFTYDKIMTTGALERIETFKLVWEGTTDQTAENMERRSASGSTQQTQLELASRFLQVLLRNGPKAKADLLWGARHIGNISESTLGRAAKSVGVVKRKFGAARGGSQVWYWALAVDQFEQLDDLVMSKQPEDQTTDSDRFDLTRPEGISASWTDLLHAATDGDFTWDEVVDQRALRDEEDRWTRALYEDVLRESAN